MGGNSGAAATLGAAVYLSCGLVAVFSSSLISSASTLSTGDYLLLWGEAIVMTLLGFLLLVSAFLVNSRDSLRQIVGFVMGSLVSVIGVIDALSLINLTTGLVSQGIAYNPQLSIALAYLQIGVIITIFAGFPLGLVGSLRMFHGDETEDSEIAQ